MLAFMGIAAAGYYFLGNKSDSFVAPGAIPGASSGTSAAVVQADPTFPDGQTIQYTEAPKYVGRTETVTGTLVRVYTSKSGTTFFDYCQSGSCPFSAVVFASDSGKFAPTTSTAPSKKKSAKTTPNFTMYVGKPIQVTGLIKSYQGTAEIVIDDPSQIDFAGG